ncbi:MAG: hypothetical protein L0220_23480, partial [Acidobacteria bacterium]|nr:hypothetical protein [Acidobacteriota bacterium]
GLTLEQVLEYVADHPEMETGLYHVPHHKGIIGTGANFIKHVSELMKADREARVSTFAAAD